jgi:hypothetical protein
MRKLYTLLTAIIITSSAFAQAPEKMSYQAVIRDGSNALVASSSVGMQISILQGSASGTAVYVETQAPTSNTNGLVSIEIGNGTLVSGNFTTIDWANGPYFVKTETDPTGGSAYTITGTSQLLSVPYALYAKNVENASCLTVSTTQVFNGISPTSWSSLDLSSAVGVNFASVTLKVTNLSGSSGILALFRQNGDTGDYAVGADTDNMTSLGFNGVGQAIIYTDSNGIIEWKANGAVSVIIEVVAFTK